MMIKFAQYVELFEECLSELEMCEDPDGSAAELRLQLKDGDTFKKVLHEWT